MLRFRAWYGWNCTKTHENKRKSGAWALLFVALSASCRYRTKRPFSPKTSGPFSRSKFAICAGVVFTVFLRFGGTRWLALIRSFLAELNLGNMGKGISQNCKTKNTDKTQQCVRWRYQNNAAISKTISTNCANMHEKTRKRHGDVRPWYQTQIRPQSSNISSSRAAASVGGNQ